MSEAPRPGPQIGKTPRMLRLVIVCLLVWVVCGFLTWYASNYLDACCDMSTFSKLFG